MQFCRHTTLTYERLVVLNVVSHGREMNFCVIIDELTAETR